MRQRLLLIALVTLLALASLLPTLHPDLRLPWLPAEPLRVDQPLSEGTEMVLEVDLAAAVSASVDDDLDGLLDLEATPVEGASREGTAGLLLRSPAGGQEVADLVERELFGRYTHTGSEAGVHRFHLTPARQAELEARAVARSMEVLEARAEQLCLEDARFEHDGQGQIRATFTGSPSRGCP